MPVIDLRIRFRLGNSIYGKKTAIIILKNADNGKERLMGCVVDSVSDVFYTEDSDILDIPSESINIDKRFVDGLMTANDQAITLLSLANLLSLDLIKHPFSGKVSVGG